MILHLEPANDWRENFKGAVEGKVESLVGVGVTAYNRIGPALFYPDYRVVCYRDSADVEILSKKVEVKSIQKDFSDEGGIEKLNSASIIKHTGVERYLKSLGNVGLLLYRATEQIWRVAEEKKYKILANHPDIRDMFEDKERFFNIGRKIGLPMVPGMQMGIEEIYKMSYEELANRVGSALVMQLVDISLGGGKGTFFVNSQDDYDGFVRDIKLIGRKRKLTKVNVTRFIEGPSPSITGCVTRHGVLAGVVQTQVLDVKELSVPGRQGAFQGHDWSYRHYPDRIQKQAEGMARTLGSYMASKGYRGVFGMDLIIDEKENKVYPVECNPRYTGAFPVYSMIQNDRGEIPIDVFQILEFLDIEYEVDLDRVQDSWRQARSGAHLVLVNPNNKAAIAGKEIGAGLFRLRGDGLERVGDGVFFDDIRDENEFVLTDGVLRKGQVVKPYMRAGRLVFKSGVLKSKGELNDLAKQAVRAVMRAYELATKEPV